MTPTIEQVCERVAREFLRLDRVETGRGPVWRRYHDETRATWQTVPAPAPSAEFFFACWDECKRRGISVFPSLSIGATPEQLTALCWGEDLNITESHGDPREALPRAIWEWLEEQA